MRARTSLWPSGAFGKLALDRLGAPVARAPIPTSVRDANANRNAIASAQHARVWTEARDHLWGVLDPLVAPGASVAVVGAGNCDDIPLTRLARRASCVDLIDIDATAPRRAVSREPRWLRGRLHVQVEDVTDGAADRVLAGAVHGHDPPVEAPRSGTVGGGRYDVVIGDLLYSQLLFPALLDSGVPADSRAEILARHGPRLTEAVVRRLHASAGQGPVVHLHDIAGWWQHHPQPVSIERVLQDPVDVALSRPLTAPLGCEPRDAIYAAGARIVHTDLWGWPFCDGVDYLVCATVAVGGSSWRSRTDRCGDS